jgi:hypothetical protein
VHALEGDLGQPERELSPARSRAERLWDVLRHVLVVGWLVVVVATVLLGVRTASWFDVARLVEDGEVETVRVSEELGGQVTGYATVTVQWRHGPFRYQAEVIQVRGGQRVLDEALSSDEDPVVVHEAPSARLAALQPGLRVQHDVVRQSDGSMLRWRVPNPIGIVAFVLHLAGLGLLVTGPQPWRATRWAWFWLLVPPVGSIAFLLLSGPTAGMPAPKSPGRRLSGGWAFLLSLPLSGAVGALLG